MYVHFVRRLLQGVSPRFVPPSCTPADILDDTFGDINVKQKFERAFPMLTPQGEKLKE